VPKAVLTTLVGRTGRYPETSKVGDYYHPVLADTNPSDTDHWLYTEYEMKRSKKVSIFHQPPGLLETKSGWESNPNAENLANLPTNYYMDMAEANFWDEEYIKVKCNGQYGITRSGKPVFHEFNDNIHSLDNIEFDKDYPIDLFWDYGLTPCVVFKQMSKLGQLRAVKEFCAERSGLRQFAKYVVLPFIKTELNGFKIRYSVGDPAGSAAKDTDENYCHNVLTELGLITQSAITNKISTRLDAGRYWLSGLIDGHPSFVLSKSGCPTLRKALMNKYCYERVRIVGQEAYKDTPCKTHPWSDVADCFEYGCMHYKSELDISILGHYDPQPSDFRQRQPKNRVGGY
jgi:hypothetical protein